MVRYIEENEADSTVHEPAPSAFLALLVKDRISHSFPLRGEVQLGREKDNAIVVADQKVSRHHAILTPIDETYIIQDQGSANGTYINGVQMAQPTRLQDKDQIRLGDTTFLFVAGPNQPGSLDLPLSAAAVSAAPHLNRRPSISLLTNDNMPIWWAIGCMAAAIIVLLIILAVMFGLFLGRSQTLGIVSLWLAYMI